MTRSIPVRKITWMRALRRFQKTKKRTKGGTPTAQAIPRLEYTFQMVFLVSEAPTWILAMKDRLLSNKLSL